jgi:hypothetical protein
MVVLEESVEVANAMGKLQTSEAKIGELRKKCFPPTRAPSSVQEAPNIENGSPILVDGTEQTERAHRKVEGSEGGAGTVQEGNTKSNREIDVDMIAIGQRRTRIREDNRS